MVDTYVVGTTGKATILKDKDAVLDYIFDWTTWLDDVADSITSKTVTLGATPTGLTLDSSSIVGKTVVAWISDGTEGQTYSVTCHIVTAQGREDDRTIYIKIKDR